MFFLTEEDPFANERELLAQIEAAMELEGKLLQVLVPNYFNRTLFYFRT
jgi:hypothetical protein